MAPRWIFLSLAWAACGCSWTRFDDVGRNAPVVLLKKPESMKSGFGVTVATASVEKSTRVLVGGTSGKSRASAFDLGTGTSPQVDAVDTGYCSQDVPCYLADKVTGLASAAVGSASPEELCFVFGIGKAAGAPEYGLIGRCLSTVEYTLTVPPPVLKKLIKDEVLLQDAPAPLGLSTDKADAPALIAGASSTRLAWFYPPLSTKPTQLVAPGEADESFGASVAVLRLGGDADAGPSERLLAVGAPAAGHVWLFRGSDGLPVGCLGSPGLGLALASGRVDTDVSDDLVVSDGTNVTVISGKSLEGLAPATDITCTMAALPEGALIASFGCGSRETITGCPGGFGTSLDVGDLDGDGDGEVLVGAPQMSVRGTANAGAVLVYDAEGDRPQLLTDQVFLSSAESDDKLGSAIAAAHIEGRDVVVAGVPGSGRTAVFYCSNLLPGGAGGERCQ
jgi:hypothetical protein